MSGLSSETWCLDGLEHNSGNRFFLIIVAKLFQKREPKHKYDVEHLGTQFLILTDGGGRYLNNRLCSCPLVFYTFLLLGSNRARKLEGGITV